MFPKIRNENLVKPFVLLIPEFIEQCQLPGGFRLYLLIKGFEIWFILTNVTNMQESPRNKGELVFFSNLNQI